MKVHPAAELFPMLGERELAALAADIRENGQLHPIVVWDGVVVDGRNRLRACELAGVDPVFAERSFASEWECASFVASVNIARRHLSDSQRAMVGAELEKRFAPAARERQGTRNDLVAELPRSEPRKARDEAADVVNVSPRLVQDAKKIQQRGCAELREAVSSGLIKVSSAAQIVELPEADQRWIVEAVRDGRAVNVPQALRLLREEQRVKAAARRPMPASSIIVVGSVLDNLDVFRGAHCVVTDPPYGIETHRTRVGGTDYADGQGYALDLLEQTMAALAERIAEDAHLYVFSGYSHVAAFKQILSRHFEVQDNPLIWAKTNHTMCDFSQWYASKHEYVIFARRRGSKRPIVNGAVGDVFTFGRGTDTTHSAEKPVGLLETLIEQSTVAGELVADPFVGSGSTAVACARKRRRFIGTELDAKWADVAIARVKSTEAA